MRYFHRLLWLALLPLLLIVPAASAQTTSPARDLLLVAVAPRTQDTAINADIYLIRSDGSRVINLTDTEFDSENGSGQLVSDERILRLCSRINQRVIRS
jgi:hypothetical protein